MTQESLQNASVAQLCDEVGKYLVQSERLCRQIAPVDLGQTPLYFVQQSRLPLDLGTRYHYAYTLPWLDLIHREHIEPWLGRGPCAIVNDIGIIEDIDPDTLEYVTINLALHEFAHMLDRPSLYDPYAGVTRERIHFDSLVLIESSKKPARPELPLFYGHGPAFIRTVIHLAYRASLFGFSTAAAGIFNAQRHGLSLTAWYVEALEDEPKRLADTPIRHILASEPPALFDQLWAEDMHRYSIRFSPIQESKP